MTTKNIVIVGGGVTGWTVASLLAKHLPRELVRIQLICDNQQKLEPAEFTRSAIHRFHELIGLAEKTCVLDNKAGFGLGMWCQNTDKDYVLAEGVYGAPLNGIDFQSLYYKTMLSGASHKFEDCSLNAVAARAGRFGHPVADAKSIYSTIQYGLNLELGSYSQILRQHALNYGVVFIESSSDSLSVRVKDGAIESVILADGKSLSADLFVDCTGEHSKLIGALEVGSVNDPFDEVFDSMVWGYRPLPADAKPVAQLIMKEAGYLKLIPLKCEEYVCFTYASQFTNVEKVKGEMNALNVSDLHFSSVHCKKKAQFWVNNCVAVGDTAAGAYDVLISPLSLARNAAVRLLDLLIDFNEMDASAAEYNRLTQLELAQLRELTELHFYLGKESNAALSAYFKQHTLSANAQHRLDLFACTGRHTQSLSDIFTDSEWAAFWLGNQILPRTCNIDADNFDQEKLMEYIERLKAAIYSAATKMPMHADYVARMA